ncbi:MAG: hypothetical protein ACTSVV_00405, partial [Promethearchaeota archaeon]
MTKKKSFTILFSLFFVFTMFLPLIPMIPIIEDKQNNSIINDEPDLELTTKNTSVIEQGSATGTGNSQSLTMTCTSVDQFVNHNSTNDFNITANNWNLTNGFLNFTDIYSPEAVRII